MPGSIFLEGEQGLIEMTEQPWEAEERLQELLTRYPNMLAGDQMNQTEPRRWLLVSREFGIPGETDAAGRWSLDHLFLDQDAVPTLVEVKRSTDTRIRREVVGQMFDYASHLVTNVSAERIRQTFEVSLAPGADPEVALAAALGPEIDAEDFWLHLKDNIAASKLRLVFVADEFPSEFRRIVEFLNRQMLQTDVFAVEVRQFVSPDGSHRTLVPRLVGRVEAKPPTSSGAGPGRRWDRLRFLEALGPENQHLVPTVDRLIRFGTEVTGRDVEWGMGRDRGSFTARLVLDEHRFSLFSVYTSAEVSINVGWSVDTLNSFDGSYSEVLRRRVMDVFGQTLSQNTWERGWSMMPLGLVDENPGRFEGFISDCVTELKNMVAASSVP